MRTTLIVNPDASKVTPALAEQVAHALWTRRKPSSRSAAGHATELAREADAEAVVVFSGDGGFNEALNGARPETALGFVPGGGTSVLPRALGLPRDPVAAARRLAARANAADLARARERAPLRLRRRGRSRRRADPPDGRARPATPTASGPVTPSSPGPPSRRSPRARVRFEPALEVEGHGRAAFALVANADPYTLPRPAAAPAAARRPARRRSRRARARAPSGCGRCREPSATSSRAERGCRSSSCTTRTGSRSAATGRCRCSSTARTSATSRRSCSRPSGTPSPSSSESRQ